MIPNSPLHYLLLGEMEAKQLVKYANTGDVRTEVEPVVRSVIDRDEEISTQKADFSVHVLDGAARRFHFDNCLDSIKVIQ